MEPKKVQARNESGQNGTKKWLYNIQEVNFMVKMKPESVQAKNIWTK